jgi:hypothetical protein
MISRLADSSAQAPKQTNLSSDLNTEYKGKQHQSFEFSDPIIQMRRSVISMYTINNSSISYQAKQFVHLPFVSTAFFSTTRTTPTATVCFMPQNGERPRAA